MDRGAERRVASFWRRWRGVIELLLGNILPIY